MVFPHLAGQPFTSEGKMEAERSLQRCCFGYGMIGMSVCPLEVVMDGRTSAEMKKP